MVESQTSGARDEADEDALVERARTAARAAYAPYSRYHVGAALESADGRVFAGCNVENASYPVGVCAERVALGNAVASGARRFRRIVVAAMSGGPPPPCGMCRQALAEFGTGLRVIAVGADDERRRWSLAELLPSDFGAGRLPRANLPGGDPAADDRNATREEA